MTPKILSFLVGKGGAAKTTLAYSVGKYAHDQGSKVLLIDADPNTSLTNQYERRVASHSNGYIKELDFPEVRSMNPNMKAGVASQIRKQAESFDLVIVDLAGSFNPFQEAVALCSDMIIVPTKTEDKFVQPALDTMDILTELQEANNGLPIVALARMAFPRRGIVAGSQNKKLEEFSCLTNFTTPYPKQYEISDIFGYSITELDKIGTKTENESASTCAIQMRHLCKEILDIVEAI
ncbi:MAG: cellulose biosynthesis protein BcsQ [Oleiphilaceae bacterium]|jgi:cellulose biosynthesis protein BcsQ